MTRAAIRPTTCIVRDTAQPGRTRTVGPGFTAMEQLHYGRIILDGAAAPLDGAAAPLDGAAAPLGAAAAPVDVTASDFETGLICLKGRATVTAGGRTFAMQPYDALYIPRDTAFRVAPDAGTGCDFAELSARVEGKYPLQFVKFADVQNDPGLHFSAGSEASRRDLNILIGKNVEAGRILAGVTFSQPGNWTSWPPHEHGAMLEEAYLYINMPAPAFGVQLVYTDKGDPELATIVRENDVVLMPQGYHPNVAAPCGSINFVWMMAAHREREDRQFGVVNVQPDFATSGSGLDPGRAR